MSFLTFRHLELIFIQSITWIPLKTLCHLFDLQWWVIKLNILNSSYIGKALSLILVFIPCLFWFVCIVVCPTYFLTFKGNIEPFFLSASLYDIAKKEKLTENFHFQLNDPNVLNLIFSNTVSFLIIGRTLYQCNVLLLEFWLTPLGEIWRWYRMHQVPIFNWES